MTRYLNPGYRPSGLESTDKVMVILNNDSEHGPWIVSSRQGSINWQTKSPHDVLWPFAIKEWWRV